MAEGVAAPNADIAGRSIREINFRQRFLHSHGCHRQVEYQAKTTFLYDIGRHRFL